MLGFGMVIGDNVGVWSVEQPSAGCMDGNTSIMTEGPKSNDAIVGITVEQSAKRNNPEDNWHLRDNEIVWRQERTLLVVHRTKEPSC